MNRFRNKYIVIYHLKSNLLCTLELVTWTINYFTGLFCFLMRFYLCNWLMQLEKQLRLKYVHEFSWAEFRAGGDTWRYRWVLSTYFAASEHKATLEVLERQQWPPLTFRLHQSWPHRRVPICRLQHRGEPKEMWRHLCEPGSCISNQLTNLPTNQPTNQPTNKQTNNQTDRPTNQLTI
jgi:hypothetical protein